MTDIKPAEVPKLSALELFQGLDSNEVLYLEHNILYYMREAIRMFMVEAKQSQHLSQFISRHTKRTFDKYVFKNSPNTTTEQEQKSIFEEQDTGEVESTCRFNPLEAMNEVFYQVANLSNNSPSRRIGRVQSSAANL